MDGATSTIIATTIGGLLGIWGTILTLRHTLRLELRKSTLSELKEKKFYIEQLKKELIHDWSSESVEENEHNIIDEYKSVSKFLTLKSHIFIGSNKIEHFQAEIIEIDNRDDTGFTAPMEILYQQLDLVNNFKEFINSELKETVKQIYKLTGIK